jgi:hypothetical protein
MNLDQFLQQAQGAFPVRNAYVHEPGFKHLYVRYTRRYLDSMICAPVLDIASIEAHKKGKQAFTNLFNHIRTAYPQLYIYVENVLNARFEAKLISLGFIQVGSDDFSPSFYIKKEQT